MDRLVVIGTSYRLCDARLLGDMTLPPEDIESRLRALAAQIGARGLLYNATCNRVEVVIERDPAVGALDYRRRVFAALVGRKPEPGESDRLFRVWQGEGALEHLFLVAAGLDSAQLGEREIYLQVRRSWKQARAAGTCSPLIERALVKALQVAREAHQAMLRTGNSASLGEVAAAHMLEWLAQAEDAPRAILVGVSPMTRRCFDILMDKGIDTLVVNRSVESAQKLTHNRAARAVSLEDFIAEPQAGDAILLAVSARHPLLDAPTLAAISRQNAGPRPPLIVDMGVPPNVDPEAAAAAGCARLSMDEISEEANASRTARLIELAPMRRVIDEGLEQARRDFAERATGRLIKGVQEQYQITLRQAVDWLIRRELPHLSPADQAKMAEWADAVAKRCAHIPVKGIKALSAEGGSNMTRVFLAPSLDELVPSLHQALDELDDDISEDV